MRRSIQRLSKFSTSLSSAALCLSVSLSWLVACGDQELEGAASEVKETAVQLNFPEVPTFDMPSPHPDGTHSVQEMRLKGRKLFKSEVEIKGFVTWIYSCEEELRTGDMTEKDVAKLIEEHPEKCNMPHFYIGDTPDTDPDKSVWVVEVPRAPRKDERKKLKRAELKAMLDAVPVFDLGDEVVVKGTWDNSSPRGFGKSEGLLVYREMNNLTKAAPE